MITEHDIEFMQIAIREARRSVDQGSRWITARAFAM